IDLLVTDITMPHMNGKELYHRLVLTRPFLRVLYMSGYTQNVIDHQHVLEDGIQFLEKPFTMDNLLRRVREALSAHSASHDTPS
ncbi:MAG TPA: response regulator, partial [Armatimonadota bacterium]